MWPTFSHQPVGNYAYHYIYMISQTTMVAFNQNSAAFWSKKQFKKNNYTCLPVWQKNELIFSKRIFSKPTDISHHHPAAARLCRLHPSTCGLEAPCPQREMYRKLARHVSGANQKYHLYSIVGGFKYLFYMFIPIWVRFPFLQIFL